MKLRQTEYKQDKAENKHLNININTYRKHIEKDTLFTPLEHL